MADIARIHTKGQIVDTIQLSIDFPEKKGDLLKDCIERAISDEDPIKHMIFENEELTKFTISNIEFEKVKFIQCSLKECNFSSAKFYQVEFMNCNVSLSDFTKTYWKKSKILESNAVGTKFIESTAKELLMTNDKFDYSNFYNTIFDNCFIDSCTFIESTLADSKIKKTTFKNTAFSRADFFKTSFKGIDLSDCLIDGIKTSADLFELKGAKINYEQAVSLIRFFGIEII